jgi:hypothetical protein
MSTCIILVLQLCTQLTLLSGVNDDVSTTVGTSALLHLHSLSARITEKHSKPRTEK